MSKGLEAYKKFCDDVEQCVQSGGIHYIDIRNKEIIEQELKALEIIKNLYHKHLLRFEFIDLLYTHFITKEEFNLLKEVLK